MIPFPYQAAGAGMAQMPAAGGGGSGLAPNAIGAGANLTFWYNGDASLHYTLPESTSPQATSDLDNVARFDSDNSIARIFNTAAQFPKRKIPIIGSSNGTRVFGGSNGQIQGFVRPSAGATPTTNLTCANLFTTSNAIAIMAIKVVDCPVATGTTYFDESIFGDGGAGWIGLYAAKSGTDVILKGYNFNNTTGENAACTTSEALGAWVVVTFIHRSNLVKIRKNGVEIASVSSGATGGLTGIPTLGTANANTDIHYAQFCTYNAAITDANILEVERYFGNRVGLTI